MLEITERPLSIALNPLAIIDRIIGGLELTPDQYELAKKGYQHVAEILRRQNSVVIAFSPDIFPQGSIRLGTTVRPIGAERFDLDMVCKLMIAGKNQTPHTIHNLVWEALGQDETCKKIRERKSRCIRLTLPESTKFYLDVTPAIPDWNYQSPLLLVPDRELKIWCSSHPIGYADEWFKPIAETPPQFSMVAFANASESLLANRGRVERLPEYGEFEKKPLQRIVQLLKYNRNRYFQGDDVNRPSSILITTITAQSYLDTVDETFGGLIDFVISVVEKLPNYIKIENTSEGQTYIVLNPVNELENFAEKWTTVNYQKFIQWHSQLCKWIHSLRDANGVGTDVLLNRLKVSFDSDLVIKAANSIGVDTQKFHEEGRLRADNITGKVSLIVGAPIPQTIYHGK
jgi:hypothetical protein